MSGVGIERTVTLELVTVSGTLLDVNHEIKWLDARRQRLFTGFLES
jgi:hypothetical protein